MVIFRNEPESPREHEAGLIVYARRDIRLQIEGCYDFRLPCGEHYLGLIASGNSVALWSCEGKDVPLRCLLVETPLHTDIGLATQVWELKLKQLQKNQELASDVFPIRLIHCTVN